MRGSATPTEEAPARTRVTRNAGEQPFVTTYLVRRILLMFPTLIGITLVVFLVMASSPGGISAQNLIEGQNLEPQAKKALEDYYNRLYGLDQPAPLQYLRWLNNISPVGFTFDENHRLTGFSLFKGSDLGTSFRFGRPVLDLIAERVPITLLLNLLSCLSSTRRPSASGCVPRGSAAALSMSPRGVSCSPCGQCPPCSPGSC